ncbi:MAG TPA: hypothetical protein VJM82_00790 [Nitrospiraceae bacterium]|nr:hypothetical protein [Nitrospiraceae bacterium]
MSKCVYCRQRKGKRACPALGGLICSQCCGEHRVVRIACPSDCIYLDSNNEYQHKRVGDRFAQARREFYKELFELAGEKAAGLFNLIEVVTFSYFQNRRDGQDGEVIAAIQSLRRVLSPLHIPSGPQQVFAEHLKKEYEEFAKQQPQQALEQQTATEVLDRALKFVTAFSGAGLQSTRFLTGLIGYVRTYHPDIVEHVTKQQEGGRIVLPGQFTPGKVESASHVHTGPHHTHHHHH